MAIMRMRCAILTIAYWIAGIFPGQVIIIEAGKIVCISPSAHFKLFGR